MSRSIKRKIRVLNEIYFWVLDGNTIYGNQENHIRIHSKELTKSILYLDPYNWHFEIKPKTIEFAILFAIDNGWNPKEKGKVMYISMDKEGKLYKLPKGIKFGHLDKDNH